MFIHVDHTLTLHIAAHCIKLTSYQSAPVSLTITGLSMLHVCHEPVDYYHILTAFITHFHTWTLKPIPITRTNHHASKHHTWTVQPYNHNSHKPHNANMTDKIPNAAVTVSWGRLSMQLGFALPTTEVIIQPTPHVYTSYKQYFKHWWPVQLKTHQSQQHDLRYSWFPTIDMKRH